MKHTKHTFISFLLLLSLTFMSSACSQEEKAETPNTNEGNQTTESEGSENTQQEDTNNEENEVNSPEEANQIETTDEEDSNEIEEDSEKDEEEREGEEVSCEDRYTELLDEYAKDYSDCYAVIDTSKTCNESEKKTQNIVLILDQSGSMAKKIKGQTQIDIAKNAASEFINNLTEEVQFSLIFYGHKGSNQLSGKEESCNGIEQVYPIGAIQKDDVKSAIDTAKAVGYTPIAASLEKAGEILNSYNSSEYENTIILVSDGEETCDGDPIAVAQNLYTKNIQVNTIGFNVGGTAEAQLKQISVASKGTYYPARNAEELSAVFAQMTRIVCVGAEGAWEKGLQDSLNLNYCRSQLNSEKLQLHLANVNYTESQECQEYVEKQYKERYESILTQIDEAQSQGFEDLDEINPLTDEEFFGEVKQGDPSPINIDTQLPNGMNVDNYIDTNQLDQLKDIQF